MMRDAVKALLNVLALAITAPAALTCWLQEQIVGGHVVFIFWTHVAAQLPGAPGMFIRRGLYRWMLPACAENVTIEFGSILNRRAELAPGVYIGTYALIGWVRIGEHSLIGSRCSIPSGSHQHVFLPSGRWSATEVLRLTQVTIGANTWIGEGAVIMADVGARCMVAAGAVVAAPLPDGVMVAGNPARFVRHVVPSDADAHAPPVPSVR